MTPLISGVFLRLRVTGIAVKAIDVGRMQTATHKIMTFQAGMHSSQIMGITRAACATFVVCAAALAIAQNTPSTESLPHTVAEAKTASLSLPSTPGLLREDQINDLIQRVVAN